MLQIIYIILCNFHVHRCMHACTCGCMCMYNSNSPVVGHGRPWPAQCNNMVKGHHIV